MIDINECFKELPICINDLTLTTKTLSTILKSSLFVTDFIEDSAEFEESSPTFDFSNCFIKAIEGSGGFGVALLIYDYKTMNDYVLKLEYQTNICNKDKEIKVYKKLKSNPHQNCLSVVAYGNTDKKRTLLKLIRQGSLSSGGMSYSIGPSIDDPTSCSFLVLECGICSLWDLQQHRRTQKTQWTENELWFILLSIVESLWHLKQMGIAHLDVKPENVLIAKDQNQSMIIKICDFSISPIFHGTDKTVSHGNKGTSGYKAPEVERGGAYNPFLADVFSVGKTIVKLMTGQCSSRAPSSPVKSFTNTKDSVSNTKSNINLMEDDTPSIKIATFKKTQSLQNERYSANWELDEVLAKMLKVDTRDRLNLDELKKLLDEKCKDKKYEEEKLIILKEAYLSRQNKFRIRAEKKDDFYAQFYLGFMNQHGLGISTDLTQAVTWYEKSTKNGNFVAQSYLGHIYLRGSSAIEVDYKKSLELFKNFMQQQNYSTHPFTKIFYSDLGKVHYKLGHFEESIEFYLKAIEIKIASFGDQHLETATSYEEVAQSYATNEQYSVAIDFYKRSLNIKMKHSPYHNSSIANLYEKLASVYSHDKQFDQAKIYSQKALSLRSVGPYDLNLETASSYNSQGLACMRAKDYKQALEYFEKSAKIREAKLGSLHPKLACSYNNLGLIQRRLKNYTKSLEWHERALKIREAKLESNHPDIARSLNNIGTVHAAMGNHHTALSFYTEALDQRSQANSQEEYAATLSNMAVSYKSLKNFDAAIKNFTEALQIKVAVHKVKRLHVVIAYKNLASAYQAAGHYEDSLYFHFKALDAAAKGEAKRYVIELYSCISINCFRLAYFKLAAEYEMKYWESISQSKGESPKSLAKKFENLGENYRKEGIELRKKMQYQDAINCFLEAIKFREKAESPSDNKLGYIYSDIGKAYKQMQRFSESENYMKMANAILHPDSKEIDYENYYASTPTAPRSSFRGQRVYTPKSL
jgi:tetratricopeptide (TPR) repeat protein